LKVEVALPANASCVLYATCRAVLYATCLAVLHATCRAVLYAWCRAVLYATWRAVLYVTCRAVLYAKCRAVLYMPMRRGRPTRSLSSSQASASTVGRSSRIPSANRSLPTARAQALIAVRTRARSTHCAHAYMHARARCDSHCAWHCCSPPTKQFPRRVRSRLHSLAQRHPCVPLRSLLRRAAAHARVGGLSAPVSERARAIDCVCARGARACRNCAAPVAVAMPHLRGLLRQACARISTRWTTAAGDVADGRRPDADELQGHGSGRQAQLPVQPSRFASIVRACVRARA
jgi:hypothetical protein